jgi:hypothetical protein
MNFIVNNNEPAKYTDKQEVIWLLTQSVQNGNSIETRMKHIQDIQDIRWRYERNNSASSKRNNRRNYPNYQ